MLEELNSSVLGQMTWVDHELSTAQVAKEEDLINSSAQLQWTKPGMALCDLMFPLCLLSR